MRPLAVRVCPRTERARQLPRADGAIVFLVLVLVAARVGLLRLLVLPRLAVLRVASFASGLLGAALDVGCLRGDGEVVLAVAVRSVVRRGQVIGSRVVARIRERIFWAPRRGGAEKMLADGLLQR